MTATLPEKICSTCRALLPLDAFGTDKKQRDGKNHKCKACRRITSQEWRDRNPTAAALKSAREAAMRENGTIPTPDQIAAKRAALDALKASPPAGAKDMTPEEDQATLPPGLLNRHTVARQAGIHPCTLHEHRKLNTCGIQDARVQLRRKGHPTRALFDALKAAPFIEFMKAKAPARGPQPSTN